MFLEFEYLRVSQLWVCLDFWSVSNVPQLSVVARLRLKKQIQQLENHIRDKESQKSQFLSSTATRIFQYETPKSTNYKMDQPQTDFRAHVSDQGRYACDSWNTPRDSSFSVDRYGLSSAPVEREQYVPKIIDVTYTEGSNDKKWSSREFPWTRKLEVICWVSLFFVHLRSMCSCVSLQSSG